MAVHLLDWEDLWLPVCPRRVLGQLRKWALPPNTVSCLFLHITYHIDISRSTLSVNANLEAKPSASAEGACLLPYSNRLNSAEPA